MASLTRPSSSDRHCSWRSRRVGEPDIAERKSCIALAIDFVQELPRAAIEDGGDNDIPRHAGVDLAKKDFLGAPKQA
jgi:hypothetical protein